MFFKNLRADIRAAKENDPAARNKFEIFLTYSGVHALSAHRVANFFYRIRWRLFARIISQWAKFRTGIEIHPAAKIEGGVFIDHGAGVVIGETAEVAAGCVLYQGVTLGGTGKQTGKRHPTLEKNCMVSAGAKVLGDIVLHEGAKVGAGAVVLKDVPANATVVGVPARVVRVKGQKENVDLHQERGDPYLAEICSLRNRVIELENEVKKLTDDFTPRPHGELGERLQEELKEDIEKCGPPEEGEYDYII
jgi:serine O-acetyltransferase